MGKIVGDAKLAEQKMGISTLFLSFGFLEWYESDASDKKAFAPLKSHRSCRVKLVQLTK
jgi:hypothetical protein